MSEERYWDLNEEEDIIMYDTRDEYWRYIAEDGEDKKKINSMRWEVYIEEK